MNKKEICVNLLTSLSALNWILLIFTPSTILFISGMILVFFMDLILFNKDNVMKLFPAGELKYKFSKFISKITIILLNTLKVIKYALKFRHQAGKVV